jgi:hypothetical protein
MILSINVSFTGFYQNLSEQYIKMILEGSVRTLSKPVQKKEPITSDILKTILRKQYPIDNLQKLTICCLLLLGYAGFYQLLVNIFHTSQLDKYHC